MTARGYRAPWLALVSLLALATGARAEERILAFDSHIRVARDGTLEVREEIRVNAEGRSIRRGIYRDFPTSYPAQDGRTVVVGFAFVGATRDGADEPWRIETRGNGQRIYLGNPQATVTPGVHTYQLIYRTDRQMGYFADHDELYWNVTGNGWAFPIERATATIELPDAIPRDQVKLEAYTGKVGARGRDYRAELRDGKPHYSTTRRLKVNEGLTIVASWPKGFVMPGVEKPPPLAGPTHSPGYTFSGEGAGSARHIGWSPLESLLDRRLPHDSRVFWFTLAGLLALIGYYLFIWNRVGRDPPGRVVIPQYEPPAGLSPAAMRYLLRMSYDDECFGAAVLSLAIKGYLRIQQESSALGFSKTFTLIKSPVPDGQALSADEHVLLKKLFAAGDTLVLKDANHRVVGGARTAHYACLKNLYGAGFFRINGGWHFLGIMLSIAVLVIALVLPGAGDDWPWWHLTTPLGWATSVMALGGLFLNGVFGWLLKAPTVKGQAALEHIRGFKMYLEVAEGEDLERVTAPPPPMSTRIFETYLPAALALGVEQRWAERFAEVLDVQAPDYQPGWYSGPGFDARRLGAFSSQLGSSLSMAISASSTPPGSSSGSGGRGSSGGGGGGGGGGGW